MRKRFISVLLSMAVAFACIPGVCSAKAADADGIGSSSVGSSYQEYIAGKSSAPSDAVVKINATQFTSASGDNKPEAGVYKGRKALADYEGSTVTWSFTIANDGLYDVMITYLPLEGKGNDIERSLSVDGRVPYAEAKSLYFSRSWVNKGSKIYTSSGNEYRRAQVEDSVWSESGLFSSVGYDDSSLQIYLTKGRHTLSLEATAEPMAISEIKLYVKDTLPSYAEVKKSYEEKGYADAGTTVNAEAEDAVRKSSPMLYAVEDRTSPNNSPYDESKILLNCIGSDNWKYKGQWIEWNIDVPKTGIYKLSMRAKQNFVSGANASRRLTIDGKVPFQEAENITVAYSLRWQMVTLGGDEPYEFYLTKGSHVLRLQVVTGSLSSVLYSVNSTVQNLNTIYRKIIMLTGYFPDSTRDYDLEENIPELTSTLKSALKALQSADSSLVGLSGGKGEQSVYIDQLIVQLKSFLNKPDTIPSRLTEFNDNINALASWVASAAEVPLLIDYFTLSPVDENLPDANAGFLTDVWSSVKSFMLSFVKDYYSIESFTGKNESKGQVTLWLAGNSGRDQTMIIKNLADNDFTTKTGISLNLKLVDLDVLLRAVSSGKGPDVAIFQSQAQPLNYGVRGALYDLSSFSDIDTVCKRFADSALTPFRLGKSLYGLPEQQVFPMMFCRTDILSELGVSYPETWDELNALIPILQEKNMEIGLPTPVSVQSGSDATAINSVFASLLLQNGGTVYDSQSRLCTLNSTVAINSFIQWSEYYTKYNFPKSYSEINRFRTGTMPILITAYTFYNTLSLAAPEIQGLWTMVPVPGTVSTDGTIHREVASGVSSCIMFKNAKSPEDSWEFLKWWTSDDTQVSYGREIEALQGPSARWPTANLNAMQKLGWSSSVSSAIQEQWRYVKGIPEVPGGYYVGRSVDNAIKSVINMGENARETLLDAVSDINEEILNKRQEFGLEKAK